MHLKTSPKMIAKKVDLHSAHEFGMHNDFISCAFKG